jgi:pimeloyl-ACP methyl ester carboxylesterase
MPFCKTNGIKMFYEERGTGEALLLIMGITARGNVWEKHLDYWSQQFRCIIADNRGVGYSEIPEGPYSTKQMADDYAGLLDFLDIGSAHVAGVSMGATIAQQLCIHYPAKIKSVVLMCPWARCDHMAKAIFQSMLDAKENLKPDQFVRHIQLLIFSKASWDNAAFYQQMLKDQESALVDEVPQPLKGLKAQAAACINHNVLEQLPGIDLPCLVIGGSADIFTPVWMAQEVHENIRGSELFLYPQSGHAFHWENIDDFNPRVAEWLNKRVVGQT